MKSFTSLPLPVQTDDIPALRVIPPTWWGASPHLLGGRGWCGAPALLGAGGLIPLAGNRAGPAAAGRNRVAVRLREPRDIGSGNNYRQRSGFLGGRHALCRVLGGQAAIPPRPSGKAERLLQPLGAGIVRDGHRRRGQTGRDDAAGAPGPDPGRRLPTGATGGGGAGQFPGPDGGSVGPGSLPGAPFRMTWIILYP